MSTVTDPSAMWKTKANNSEGGDFERPSPGMYPAVLIGLIDIGTHTHVYNGKQITGRKLFLCWELTGENDSNGQAFVIAQDYTWSLHKKANLRALIEGWFGRSLSDAEEFDIISLLGKECCLTVSEGQTPNGKKFSEIKGVGPTMKGQVVPPPTRELFAFNVGLLNSSGDAVEIPEWVPRNYGRPIVDEIKASAEFQDLPGF